MFCTSIWAEETRQTIKERQILFPTLTEAEKNFRGGYKLIRATNLAGDKCQLIVAKLIHELYKAEDHSKYVNIDLRYFQYIELNNIYFSNIAPPKLASFLLRKEFKDGKFILFNIYDFGIKVFQGPREKDLKNFDTSIDIHALTTHMIPKKGLNTAEFTFYFSSVEQGKLAVAGKLCFVTSDVKFTVIQERYQADISDVKVTSYDTQNCYYNNGEIAEEHFEFINQGYLTLLGQGLQIPEAMEI
jgi:hypothetical protein